MVHKVPENFNISDFDVFHSALVSTAPPLDVPDGLAPRGTGSFFGPPQFRFKGALGHSESNDLCPTPCLPKI